jgi:hypothetical protein
MIKKSILTLAVTMLATHLPAQTNPPTATFNLTISTLSNGNLQIVASSPGYWWSPPYPGYVCVLFSTTDFVTWTPISTNVPPFNVAVTNIVQATNEMTFYRAVVMWPNTALEPTPTAP